MNVLNDVISVFEELKLHQRLKFKGNLRKLYLLIRSGQVGDDHDISNHFFPSSNKETARKHLWQLKTKLTDQLISAVVMVDLDNKWTTLQKEYFKLWKHYAFCRILLGLGLRQVAVSIAEKSIKHSLKYHFTELTFSFSRILRDHYAKYVGDNRKYLHYKSLASQYLILLQKEDLLEDLYNELVLYFPIKSSIQQIREAKKYPSLVYPILKKYDYFRVHFVGFNIIVLSYQIEGEYKKVIETCETAIKSLQRFPDYPTLPFMFRLRQVPNFLQLKDYSGAEFAIQQCLTLTGSSLHNWLSSQQYNTLLGFHTENWDHSLQIIEKVKERQKEIPEIWHIYEAYAQILKGNLKFRLGKFLNQVSKLSKDKQGMNINVRIIETLYHLLHQDHGKIIDMQDALTEYSKRHLRKDQSTYRSDLFLRMLLLLPRYSFHLIGIERSAKPYLVKLKNNPLDMVLQDTDLEVVPFESLWGWVRSKLLLS